MKYLFDTQLLLFASFEARAVPVTVSALLENPEAEVYFSVASLWEVAIKFGRGKPDFTIDPVLLRLGLLRAGYRELPIAAEHVLYLKHLPAIHKDPFDRLLVAQASVEGITLLTAHRLLSQYPGPVQRV